MFLQMTGYCNYSDQGTHHLFDQLYFVGQGLCKQQTCPSSSTVTASSDVDGISTSTGSGIGSNTHLQATCQATTLMAPVAELAHVNGTLCVHAGMSLERSGCLCCHGQAVPNITMHPHKHCDRQHADISTCNACWSTDCLLVLLCECFQSSPSCAGFDMQHSL